MPTMIEPRSARPPTETARSESHVRQYAPGAAASLSSAAPMQYICAHHVGRLRVR
jgi:hypothetical protein